MALPEAFTNTAEYFRELVNHLYEFRWLYFYPNTDVFKSKVLEFAPKEWNDYFQANFQDESLRDLGLGIEIPNAPISLIKFIKRTNSLTPHYRIANLQIELEVTKGLSNKKQHEISLLAPLIQNVCRANDIDYAIDIGCGLGYLTNLLNKNEIKILGIDGNQKFIKTAQDKYPHVPFEHLYVTTDSSDDLKSLLKKHFNDFNENEHNVCLVALHACADLTVDMLKLSLAMNCLKTAIVMPCCYHRMKQVQDNNMVEGINEKGWGYVNFPLSNELKDALNELDINERWQKDFLNGTFLRLACQRADWKNQSKDQRDVQTNNLMFRNLLQLVVDKENLRVQRRRRKTGSNRGDYTIDSFLTNLQSSYEITTAVPPVLPISDESFARIKTAVKQNYEEIYAKQKSTLAAFAALQNLIQPACENLVLLDRCAYVHQRTNSSNTLGTPGTLVTQDTQHTECVNVKVTDECISPRCFALVVTKGRTREGRVGVGQFTEVVEEYSS